MHRSSFLTVIAVVVFVGVSHSQLFSQDDDSKTKEKGNSEIKERTIYIPFEKLREVFEKDNRKVVLSYKEFNELWKAARANKAIKPTAAPERRSLITQADSQAKILESVVEVESTLKVELLSEGWSEVPIGLRNSAIRSATIDGKAARIVHDPKTGYKLLAKNETTDPKVLELKLVYARAFQKGRGKSSVAFMAPSVPVNRWRIQIGQPDVKIDVTPLIAVTKPDLRVTTGDGNNTTGEDNAAVSKQGDPFDPSKETVIYAFLGVAPSVTLSWNPKSEGASGLAAVVSAQTSQQVFIDKNVQRTRAQINYEISRSELPALKIEVPLDQKVTNVFNENVRKWKVEKDDKKQTLLIELFAPIKGSQQFAVELEKLTTEALKQDFSSPVVNAVDASRQQGIVVVNLVDGLRSTIKDRRGLLQLDKSELPANLKNQNWNLAFRYASLPYQLDLNVERVLPRIVAQQLLEVDLKPQQLKATANFIYDIKQAGIFRTRFRIPEGYEVRSIGGFSNGKGMQPAAVSEFRPDPTDKSIWNVDFSRKAIGRTGLRIEMQKLLSDPNLLSPTGDPSVLELPFPHVADENVEYTTGGMIVYGPISLRIASESETGVQQSTLEKARSSFSQPVKSAFASKPVLSYTFSGNQSELSVNVIRRKPKVTTRQLLSAKVENGVVKYDATFFYEVLYSGVKKLRIDLPADIASNVRNLTEGVTESEIQAADDLEENYVGWEFSSDSEFFGKRTIRLSWEQKVDDLEIGKSIEIDLPRFIPRNVDRSDGQIVTSKAETIDIQPLDGATGLVPIDPKVDLMPEAKVTDAAAAYEFSDSWKLGIRATRYDVEEVKLTNVEAGLVEMVQLRQRGLNVRAFFRIRSAVQRLGMKLPAGVDPREAFDSQPVRINGNPINLEGGSDGELFIPLTGIKTDEPFILDLRYKVNADASRMVLPTFSGNPAMQKVFLCVYVPQEKAVVGSLGSWTNELIKDKTPGQMLFDGLRNEHFTEKTTRNRVAEIRKDILNGVHQFKPAPDFKTDGRSFLFSALRPDPEQELKVVSIPRYWLNIMLIGCVAVIGLPLYRRSMTIQMAAVCLMIALVVCAGLFFPMLARQILSSALLISIGLVVLVWLIGHFVNVSGEVRDAWNARRIATQETTPAAGEENRVTGSDNPDTSDRTTGDASTDNPPDPPVFVEESNDDEQQKEGGSENE